jgi:hypothetical protein
MERIQLHASEVLAQGESPEMVDHKMPILDEFLGIFDRASFAPSARITTRRKLESLHAETCRHRSRGAARVSDRLAETLATFTVY